MALNFEDYENWIEYPTKYAPNRAERLNTYRTAEGYCANRFKRDFFKELGIENNPKKDLLFSKAVEHGHAGGYAAVMNCGYDLVNLIL